MRYSGDCFNHVAPLIMTKAVGELWKDFIWEREWNGGGISLPTGGRAKHPMSISRVQFSTWVERDTSKRIWFLCLCLVIIFYSVAAAKGGVEDERVLLSLGEKKIVTQWWNWNQHFAFSLPTKKKGEEDLILTWKFDELNMQHCLGRYLHFKCIYCHYWKNLHLVNH